MFNRDFWSEIFMALRRNKLRTILTGFAISWGIFMLIILLSAGNGLKNGVRVYTWPNGDVYDGEFVDDVRSGSGVYTWANGEKYEGEFKNNLLSGFGTYYFPSGRTYTGYFENGVPVQAESAG